MAITTGIPSLGVSLFRLSTCVRDGYRNKFMLINLLVLKLNVRGYSTQRLVHSQYVFAIYKQTGKT